MNNFSLENLTRTEEFENKLETFKVKSKDLKQVFTDLKALFKKTEFANTVQFSVVKNELFIRADAEGYTLGVIQVEEGNPKEITTNTLFKDIEKLIPGSGLCELTITPKFVKIQGRIAKCILPYSMCSINKIEFVDRKYLPLNYDSIFNSVQEMLAMTQLNKYFKKYPAILFKGDYVQYLFPQMYIQNKSSEIFATLGYTSSLLLKNIINSNLEKIQYSKMENELTFKCEDRYLTVITSPEYDTPNMLEEVEKMDLVANIAYIALGTKIKNLLSSIGEGDVEVRIYENYILLERQLSDGTNISMPIGNDSEDSTFLMSFRYRLELLSPLINYVGDNLLLYRGENTICLRDNQKIVIFSYRS